MQPQTQLPLHSNRNCKQLLEVARIYGHTNATLESRRFPIILQCKHVTYGFFNQHIRMYNNWQ